MEFDWRIRLGLVIGGVVIVGVALAGAAWGALDSDLVQQALALIGGLLGGLGIAGGRGRGAGVMALLLCAGMMTACTQHRAQVAVQSSLTGIAEGVAAGDRIVAVGIEEATDGAIEAARDRAESCEDCDPLEIYREEMAPWYAAARGLELAAASLRALQDALDIWVATGELPDGIGGLCLEVGEQVGSLVDLVDEAGVDVPEALDSAPGATAALCAFIAQRMARR